MFVVPCRATEWGRRPSVTRVWGKHMDENLRSKGDDRIKLWGIFQQFWLGGRLVVMVLPVCKECYISYSLRLSLNNLTVSINEGKKWAVHIKFWPPCKRKSIATFQHFPRSIYRNWRVYAENDERVPSDSPLLSQALLAVYSLHPQQPERNLEVP